MPFDGWNFDETASAGAEHLDEKYVASYDHKAGNDPSGDLALLSEAGLSMSSTLIDLGAGTGTFALAAAPRCQRVVAVDVSSAMLDVLQARAARAGIRNIECVRAGFLSYQHEGARADVVYSRHALHHLPDFWKSLALQRVADLLRPGGLFLLRDLLFSFELRHAESAIAVWLARAASDPADGWTRGELETHLRTEYSTFTWLVEPMLTRAGFTIQRAEYSADGIYATYLCTKADQSARKPGTSLGVRQMRE